jgi:hypothetical protein
MLVVDHENLYQHYEHDVVHFVDFPHEYYYYSPHFLPVYLLFLAMREAFAKVIVIDT